MTFRLCTRAALWRLAALLGGLAIAVGIAGCTMIWMPGSTWSKRLPPLTPDEQALADQLRRNVTRLATDIGARNTQFPEKLHEAAEYISAEFTLAGYEPERQEYRVTASTPGLICANIVAEQRGRTSPDEIVVVGAHYDSAPLDGCNAANDNASGVAATLALARRLAGRNLVRTLRFVAFANEEPPHFQTPDMGSLVYARQCAARHEKIVAMISLETLGYYRDTPGSQDYPFPMNWFYPNTGNFVAFIGNVGSRRLVRRGIAAFRRDTAFPSEGAALPERLPGVGWSDHWAFWRAGFPAIMVTDTALFRYPHYHTSLDNTGDLDYERLARVVAGLDRVISNLANGR